MHPRNIYNTPPDFSALATKYPDFLKISSVDLNGTVRLDFQDKNAVRVLTRCLLHLDFGLDVDIPENRLVPTIPLRLNYLLWLEDLLTNAGKTEDIGGIDIGTGACCVYPLLASKQFKWKMLATEIDENSVNMALKNVKQNQLEVFISVKKVEVDSQLIVHCFDGHGGMLKQTDFCMCNPPFYSSLDDLDQSRSPLRAPPRNARTGSFLEVVTAGGEVAFVKKLIQESLILKEKIRLYTTMLGHKSSLKPLLEVLRKENISQVSHTTFCQGRTTRWGLAWSFLESSKLSTQLVPKKQKQNKCMSFAIPQIDGQDYTVKVITVKLLQILKLLDIQSKILQQKDDTITMELIATRNTWSNQRRQRRQQKNISNTMNLENADLETTTKELQIPEENCQESLKRSNHTEPKAKRIKMDIEIANNHSFIAQKAPEIYHTHIKASNSEQINGSVTKGNGSPTNGDFSESEKILASTSTIQDIDSGYLKAALCIRKHECLLLLEIGYISGSAGKDGVHQIVQYIKNNWK